MEQMPDNGSRPHPHLHNNSKAKLTLVCPAIYLELQAQTPPMSLMIGMP